MPTRRRVPRTLTSAALSLMMAGSLLALPSAALAGLPSWSNWITPSDPKGLSEYADSLPGTVQPGYDAGFRVKIHNNGPSNISQLYLVASDAAPNPTYAKRQARGHATRLGRSIAHWAHCGPVQMRM